MKTIIIVLVFCGVVLFIGFIMPIPMETDDWYYFHVQECLEAHRHNMTFLYCSGFWREPDPSDFENPIAIHPLEDPWKEVPHGSCIAGNSRMIVVFGIYGWLSQY